MALFTALIGLKISFAAAHVDHSWRPESGVEAEELKDLCSRANVPFYLKKLPKREDEGWCREQRLLFFHHICTEQGCQAVMLGHQRQDQAQTTLKRLLEGARLEKLAGMNPVSCREGLVLWRPLLDVPKKDLISYLGKVKFFLDSSNDNSKFLRPRLAQKLIPALEAHFGKSIDGPLRQISSDAHELSLWIAEEAGRFPKLSGPLGTLLDFTKDELPSRFLLKRLIAGSLEDEGHLVSHNVLNLAADALQSGRINYYINKNIYIDRRRLFSLAKDYGRGCWTLTTHPASSKALTTSWKDLWRGSGMAVLPKLPYTLQYVDANRLAKRWSQEAVPPLFRKSVPVLTYQGRIVHEFLSGRKQGSDEEIWAVQLEYQKAPVI